MTTRAHFAIDALRDLIDRHCTGFQLDTAISGLTLYRAEGPVDRVPTTYWPALCIIAQGSKQVMIGQRIFEYNPLNYLVVTVDLPVAIRIAKASRNRPLLALTIDLTPTRIADVMLGMEHDVAAAHQPTALAVSAISDDLLDAVVRLVTLLDQPTDAAVLAPLIEREILYRLLRGRHAALLREIVTAGSQLSHIGRVTDWIRTHYAERTSIDDLASLAEMSTTSFHRHFKAITALSPLQYRTQMRLLEARRLMLVDAFDAGTIAHEVGYESVSQFSREYRKMFGMPPAADAARLRAGSVEPSPA